MVKKTVRDVEIKGKKVLLRVDYNVPLSDKGEIEDDTRIRETIPTLQYLIDHGASIILMSHLGRPKGSPDPKFSLHQVAAQCLEPLLKRKLQFAADCSGNEAKQKAEALSPGEILMLENLRFHPEEEKNDPIFAKNLASLGDLMVNDAFGASHRAHASIAGIPKYIPAVAGFLLEKELNALSPLLLNPPRPYIALLGGAKVSDKLCVLKNLLLKVDAVLVGGGMAFTFLKAQGFAVGNSLVEETQIDAVKKLLETDGKKIKLPSDCLAASSLQSPEQTMNVTFSKDPGSMANLQGFDLGPASIQAFKNFIEETKPKTVFWNGPMGVFEVPEFSKGTFEIAKALGAAAKEGASVIVGGGDSVAAVHLLGLAKGMTHLSTGGGASLEFLEGKTLPGVAALVDAESSIPK